MSDGLVVLGVLRAHAVAWALLPVQGPVLRIHSKGLGGITVRARLAQRLRMACRSPFKGLDCTVTHPRGRICYRASIGLVEGPLDGLSRGGWCDWSCACFSGP